MAKNAESNRRNSTGKRGGAKLPAKKFKKALIKFMKLDSRLSKAYRIDETKLRERVTL